MGVGSAGIGHSRERTDEERRSATAYLGLDRISKFRRAYTLTPPVSALRPHQFTMYLTLGIVNTIEVYAVDERGNRSAPATMTIDLRTP
jgi:hypothetical protein